MYCRRCGHKMADGERFCTQCGTPAVPEISPAEGAVIWPTAGHEGAGGHSRAAMPPPVWQGMPQVQPAMAGKKPKGSRKPLAVAMIAVGCVLVLAAGVLIPVLVEKGRTDRYEAAMALMDDEEYDAAIAAFAQMGDYRDSAERAEECRREMDYEAAQALMDAGKYGKASEAFAALGGFKDAEDKALECRNIMDYNEAQALMNAGEYPQARDRFTALGSFRDAAEQAQLCQNIMDYVAALADMEQGNYADAKRVFDRLGDYSDSARLAEECQNNIDYIAADEAYNSGFYYTAYSGFKQLKDFCDAAERAEACIQTPPDNGELYHNPDYAKKISIYIKNKGKSLDLMVKFYTMDGDLVSVVYVRPGQRVKIRLPRGEYMAKCGWGAQWFGEKEYFGKIAFYDWDYEKFVLDPGYYYTYEITTPEPENVGSGSLSYTEF